MFLGKEVHYYMVYIAYYTVLNLQICINVLDKNPYGHFGPRQKAANFCHPASEKRKNFLPQVGVVGGVDVVM